MVKVRDSTQNKHGNTENWISVVASTKRARAVAVSLRLALRMEQEPKMSRSYTQHSMEHIFGLTEVTMIRLPLKEWASAGDIRDLEQIAQTDPLPAGWPDLNSAIARSSPGFAEWLRKLASRQWTPTSDSTKEKLQRIDFSMPWCARLRWGAGNLKNVDVFIHASGSAGSVKWETI